LTATVFRGAVGGRASVPTNLDAFMKARYRFACDAIPAGSRVLGIGAGTGLSRDYLPGVELVDTDIVPTPWIDLVCDGQVLPFADGSFDAAVAMAVLHHLPFPLSGLKEIARVVCEGGRVCIQEPHASLTLRALLAVFRHEHIDFSVNPFGTESSLSRQLGPDDGNNAIGDLLFADKGRFEQAMPQFKVVHHRFRHFLLYLNSGGLAGELFHVPLPQPILKMIRRMDDGLCGFAPGLFATCQEIVLERVRDSGA
jgi:SAM-dependent methyltransferase